MFVIGSSTLTTKKNHTIMRKTNIVTRLKRIEKKCDNMQKMLNMLNKLVRGQVIDSLIDTMREEAVRMRNMSRIQSEQVTHGL